jgi:cell volume regulation protein A
LEVPASIEIAKQTLLSGGLILAIGTIAGLVAQKIKIPDVAVFPVVGILIGPEALGLINIKADSALNQIILPSAPVTFFSTAALRCGSKS